MRHMLVNCHTLQFRHVVMILLPFKTAQVEQFPLEGNNSMNCKGKENKSRAEESLA